MLLYKNFYLKGALILATIAIVGSLNIDIVMRAPYFPTRGETLIGDSFGVAGGGKGFNQALAAARLNADSYMIGCIGDDDFGYRLRSILVENRVDCGLLKVHKGVATGTALITVVGSGEHSIIISQGANALLNQNDISNAKKIFKEADCVLFQMETPPKTVTAGLKTARLAGCETFLSAEPPFSLPNEAWENIDYMILNENALNFYAGTSRHKTIDKMSEEILKRGVKNLIVTQSAKGGKVFTHDENFNYEAFNIRAIDNTGARDAFCSGLSVGLSEGMPLKAAVKFASACGALACTQMGAHPSLPWRHQVGALLGESSAEFE